MYTSVSKPVVDVDFSTGQNPSKQHKGDNAVVAARSLEQFTSCATNRQCESYSAELIAIRPRVRLETQPGGGGASATCSTQHPLEGRTECVCVCV